MKRRMRARMALRDFMASESSGGLILMAVAALALIIANSPLAPAYFGALKTYVAGLSILHWINDALMAVFFLLVGLEIKREMVEGRLSTWSQRALPGLAAAGGMIGPALVYVALNWQTPETLRGWAIPAATDIAFALGVLSLIGPRVPISLKVFLTALAIIDDLGAVIIIALFYTANLSLVWLGLAALVLAVLFGLGRMGERRLPIYLALGALLWFFVLRSGVHATLAGVLLAITIPIHGRSDDDHAPLHVLEHALAPWVAFLIVPIFGFANAGVSFSGMSFETLVQPVTLGIALGLFIGKQAGIFLVTWLADVLRIAPRPEQSTWLQVYGVSLICGIGFTMSLFIGLLAFDGSQVLQDQTKVGVLLGSLLSGLLGAAILMIAPPYRPKT